MPTFKIDVHAAPEAVFDYLADVSRHTEWANPKSSMTMEDVSGGAPGVGHTYRSTGLFTGKRVSADIEVTAFDRPRHFALRTNQHQEGKKDVWYENDYELRANAGGTTVVKTLTGGLSPLIFFIAGPAIRRDAMASLRNLKAKLEAGA
jgi:uncharacterized protein YndB with AHSA1/START domain